MKLANVTSNFVKVFNAKYDNVTNVCLQGWLEAMATAVAAGYHYCRTNFLSMKTFQVNNYLLLVIISLVKCSSA